MNAIEFENISKQYKLGYISSKTLSQDLNRWWAMHVLRKEDPMLKIGSVNNRAEKADSDYVWALRDITFNVEQGDVVGIIGKNGAGKSTLLKLLSRVTAPTTGEIRVRGRIASLLEVGTGFHLELTGRENIYMNGSIMGMTKAEIKRKFDEIVDFAGVERYVDTPVKRYSSGMLVRLGFAVAAHLDPEILVVDEVLAVGDAEFQKKAIGKMQDVSQGEGRTVLFVSHNMASIRALCNNGILLENGKVVYTGNVGDVVDRYMTEQLSGDKVDRSGSGEVTFSDYSLSTDSIVLGDDLRVDFTLHFNKQYFSELLVTVCIFNEKMEPIVQAMNTDDNVEMPKLEDGTARMSCVFKGFNLAPGRYYINLWVGTMAACFDEIRSCMTFYVEQGTTFIHRPIPYHQAFKTVLPTRWECSINK